MSFIMGLYVLFVNEKIVDDEELFRLEQKLHLEKLNVDIVEAVNGMDVLSIIEKDNVHLIITDIKMAVMDGLELLEKIKSDPEKCHIPVIGCDWI